MYTYFVYILECSDNSYYTGITNDIERRFNEHSAGIDPRSYTYKRRPVELKFHLEINDVLVAIRFEKQLKGWSRNKKKALIEGDFDRLQILAECRNATHFKYKPDN